jgi:hypothetical protein
VGIIHFSGHHQVVVDGLRAGLRELGLEEGKHLVLDIRETPPDLTAVEAAARDLERGKVDLLYLPVENYDNVGLALNLSTARAIGVAIPQALRARADRLIE